MRSLLILFIAVVLIYLPESCKPQKKNTTIQTEEPDLSGSINYRSNFPFDSTMVAPFFKSFPELTRYGKDVVIIYRKYTFNHIWYDKNGVIEFANSLYSKINILENEGVSAKFPYKSKIDGIFLDEIENTLNETDTELMLTCLFLFYSEKVHKGIDEVTTTDMGWFLPRKQLSYTDLLANYLTDPTLIERDDRTLLPQYFKLRKALLRYREIEKNGGWKRIELDPKVKAYKPGDTSRVIVQIRERLFLTGELSQNSKSNRYDDELLAGLKKFQIHNGFLPDRQILPKHIAKMNVPVGDCIKKIIVNMERFRWIEPELVKARELVFVNIPSFDLKLIRSGKIEFTSPVVVGKVMNKTVIFSGKMSYIVFSPYWNVPQSIINKEVKPGMAKNPKYLDEHNMEWNDGRVRQKPGKKNSLGLVKFIFPNSNDIYLHDTPSKSLFQRESRAFSHGCIRVGKPRDLAIEILKDDPNWTPQKIDQAMNGGVERSYTLKNKIPVYIGYFTAWVDDNGALNFYDDVYKRDNRLADIIMN